jgi:hypothetical protein
MDLQTRILAGRCHFGWGEISTVRGFRQVTLCRLQGVKLLFPRRKVQMAPERPQIDPSARTPKTRVLTYLLTQWSRILLEKLTGLQLVKKFPEFYGTRRFITAFTNARHLSLS